MNFTLVLQKNMSINSFGNSFGIHLANSRENSSVTLLEIPLGTSISIEIYSEILLEIPPEVYGGFLRIFL